MPDDPLESVEFYELMQIYRHAPTYDQQAVIAAFEAVKAFLRTVIHDQENRVPRR